MGVITAVGSYDYKKLFYQACGYISTLDNWSDKHPMEVVDFFLNNYIDIDSEDESPEQI